MLYLTGRESFRRKIWNFLNDLYRHRVDPKDSQPFSARVIEMYIGTSIAAYRTHTANAAASAGYSWDTFKLKWKIHVPRPDPTNRVKYAELHFSQHSIEPKQAYLATICCTNRVLELKIDEMIGKLLKAAVMKPHKLCKIHAMKVEKLMLWLVNEKITKENREVVRFCMNKRNMPFTIYSHWGYYRNCVISLDLNLTRLKISGS